MQFKFVWFPLVILAGVSSVYGSALGTVQDRNLAIAGDLTSRELQCNWCDCFTALAAEGVACAAAILEGGCNILADISCAVDALAFARKVPVCLACLGFHLTPPPPVTPPSSPQCCSSVVSSGNSAAALVASILSLDLTGINVPIGLSCSPITVEDSNCGGTTVTCDAPDEEWGGLIAINCLSITL
ncbi:hypothetical protein B0H17DRAFT_1208478 [Mycena rosella]|uniref:Hydrophobin n=1 Tax=Mycena rosella TaxID=1033263 RepID=A0AAD7D0R4_MYCRO|nr:hypothetical protein B0H17DRAFT_1208478 [Mycena rosella]